MKWNRSIPTVALVILIALSFVAGVAYSSLVLNPGGQMPDEFDSLAEIWGHLKKNYVNQSAIDAESLARGAIYGMLDALGDPYTTYYYDYGEFYDSLEGTFEGIGAYISKKDGWITIVSPIKGSPAEMAGIRSGDVILEIDGEPANDLTVNEAVMKIRGPKGTTVTLLIRHEGESDPVEMQIVRDTITLPSVDYEALPDGIGYLWISQFTSDTTFRFRAAINDAISDGSMGLVLDLRGNPGGFLSVVADIADEFLDSGVILYEANDNMEIFDNYTAKPGGMAVNMPVVVLVDGGSASGSEVLAGALQDHGRAVIIGTQTYGKGSVNWPIELGDGSALYITVSRWLTPDKSLIEGVGITPDYIVEFSEEDWDNGIDNQLEYAAEYLKSLIQ